jgi:hypothetical protein
MDERNPRDDREDIGQTSEEEVVGSSHSDDEFEDLDEVDDRDDVDDLEE